MNRSRRARHSGTRAAEIACAFFLGLPAVAGRLACAAPVDCPKCDDWTRPQAPFHIYGNTYYVGTRALSSILIVSKGGDILIDGTVDEAAAGVAKNIRTLGFRLKDVRVILNSHVHFDHAGGIAELQRLSGAQVRASRASAKVLEQGHSGPDDPLFGQIRSMTPIHNVQTIEDGEVVRVGDIRLFAHLTPGHTPGGTSWTWQSCEKERCLNVVYADSLSPVSAAGFRFTNSVTYPNAVSDFEHSFSLLSALPCDILLTPHPEFSGTFQRLERRESQHDPDAFIDTKGCRTYAEASKAQFARRVSQESSEAPAK